MSGRTLYHDSDEAQDTEMTTPENAPMRRRELCEQYSFYILNPEYRENVEYQLWINDQYGDEYPVVSSSSLGQAVFFSQDQGVGDAIDLTEDFFDALAAVTHKSLWHEYDDLPIEAARVWRVWGQLEYDTRPADQEMWLLAVLVNQFLNADECYPELRPLATWCADHTPFDLPILCGGE